MDLKYRLKVCTQKLCIETNKPRPLIDQYQELRTLIVDTILLLKGERPEDTLAPNAKILEKEEEVDSEEEEEVDFEEEEKYESLESLNSYLEGEFDTMALKLDIGLALKLVKPFDGNVTMLTAYIESVELLLDYAEGVPAADILKFLRTLIMYKWQWMR